MMERTYTTYRLTFTSPLHIGDFKPNEYGSSMKYISSDSLQSALMAVRVRYGLSIPENGDPGFVVSSLFPFIRRKSDDFTYFFPKPLIGLPFPEGQLQSVKKLKKVAWVDSDYLSRLLSGEEIGDYGGNDGNHINGQFLSGQFNGGNDECGSSDVVFSSQIAQRVSLPRVRQSEQDNNLFTMERLFFKKNTGLYFLFEGDKEKQRWLENSLDLLAMEGIGTDRNVGHGTFDWESGEITIELPEGAEHIVTMSLYHPEDLETLQTMIDDHSAWKLVKRGGWITDPQYQTIRKRSVYMFSEGSVFKKPDDVSTHIGLPAINLQPLEEEGEYPVDHPIWRCGRSLVLPIKIN